MDYKRLLGILLIILGIIFVVCPLFSAAVVSVMAGACIISFGIICIFNGFFMGEISSPMSIVEILLGILLIIYGFLFFVDLAALAFLVSYGFYIIAFTLMFIGIAGLISGDSGISKWASLLILILGIVFLFLAIFSITDPLIIAVLVGVCLMVRGVIYFTLGSALDEELLAEN